MQRSSDFQISFTGFRLHVCNILDHKYFISNLPVQWLLPFFIKSNLLYFNFAWQHGLLRELNIFFYFFIFRESNACLSLDEYLFIARNVLCLWFEWDWYGAIVIVRLWNMFKYMIVYDSHSKSACEVKKQLCKFIYSIIYRYMYYVWQQFYNKTYLKDVKILKKLLVEKKEIPITVLHLS